MKKIYKYLFLCSVVMIFISASLNAKNNSVNNIWDKAVKAYTEADYPQALKLFSQIDSSGYKSVGLYYNIANTYYKMDNHLSNAILYYERALRLDPSNEDVLNNLQMANNNTIDKINKLPEFFVITWIKKVMSMFTSNNWAYIALMFFILGGIFLLTFRFSSFKSIRKTAFIISLISLSFFILSLCFAMKLNSRYNDPNQAIIMSPVCSVKSAPNDTGKALFVLHEGTKLECIEDLGDWERVELADGRQGWLKKRHIETI